MSETVSFPGLGWEFEVNRVAFHLPDFLGGAAIYWYGILIALGLLAGILYFFARTKEFAVDPDRATDVLLVAIIFAVVGARLYFVLFAWDLSSLIRNPLRIFNIREGGLAIYGAVIGAIVSGAIMCKIRKVRFLPLMDLASASLFLGQAIGRWGNFVNVEAFGSNTDKPWGMKAPSTVYYLTQHRDALAKIGVAVDPEMPVHPTFFYESMWCLLGFLFLVWFAKRRRFDGQLTLIYLGWYGLGRFFIEGVRTDSLMLGTIRVSQLLALLCFLASAVAMVLALSRIRREGDPDYLALYRDTEEGKLVLAGTFYRQFDKKRKSKAAAEEATASGTIAAETQADAPDGNGEDAEAPDSPEDRTGAAEPEDSAAETDSGEDEADGENH